VAARRLIFIMLALLLIASIAAYLVPVEPPGEESSTTSTTAAELPEPGDLVRARIDAGREKRPTIKITLGDQLALTVAAPRPDRVEIAGLGELADVDPAAPARFDLLPSEPATYPVRLLDAGRIAGRIEVSRRR
jgi:hypothetical protein